MTSPFALFSNLTVVFDVPTEVQGINTTGNPALQTQLLVCMAYVTRKSMSDQRRGQTVAIGAELSQIMVEGNWIAPLQAPRNLAPEQTGAAYWWRIDSGFTLPADGFSDIATYQGFVGANQSQIVAEGNFVIGAAPPNPFGVAEIVGDKFQGYLLTKTLWADAL
ncbi:MAG: hypothetical protein AAGI45_13490 [Cyanobacteria bacterium P01_H01_bin.26]